MPELNMLLTKNCMIRRLKKQVLTQLLPKTRTAIVTEVKDKKLQKLMEDQAAIRKNLTSMLGDDDSMEQDVMAARNQDRQAMTELYQLTGAAKVKASIEYIDDLLEVPASFFVRFESCFETVLFRLTSSS